MRSLLLLCCAQKENVQGPPTRRETLTVLRTMSASVATLQHVHAGRMISPPRANIFAPFSFVLFEFSLLFSWWQRAACHNNFACDFFCRSKSSLLHLTLVCVSIFSTMAMNAQSLCFSLLWIILLFFIAWPVAGICAGVWIILQPLEAFCGCFKDCSNFVEGFVTWPRKVGNAIVNGDSSCPTPL